MYKVKEVNKTLAIPVRRLALAGGLEESKCLHENSNLDSFRMTNLKKTLKHTICKKNLSTKKLTPVQT